MRKLMRRSTRRMTLVGILLVAPWAGVVSTTLALRRAEKARQAEADQRQIAQTRGKEALKDKAKALAEVHQERLAKERSKEQLALAEEQRKLAEEQQQRAVSNLNRNQ